MPYPENFPDINDTLELPRGELAQLSVEMLAMLQAELDHASKQLKSASAKLGAALEVRYATRAAEARRACDKDTGTVRLDALFAAVTTGTAQDATPHPTHTRSDQGAT